jgi:hypothetical protein
MLKDLWTTNRDELTSKKIQQIISFCGSGKLHDGGDASAEFRDFLSYVPSALLVQYSDQCLTEKFEASGLALQDVVNEIGRRLGFNVENGRYRGTAGKSGHDGLWRSGTDCSVVVEVKTIDAYRIDLGTLDQYRRFLAAQGSLRLENSSILLVVGREDTGDLEAQIRGSRHAWDIRLISVDALLQLMRLKENLEDPQIHHKISGVLTPQEFTKVDGIIELVFSTAEKAVQDDGSGVEQIDESLEIGGDVSRPAPANFHDECVKRIQNHLGRVLVRQSRVFYTSPDGGLALVCAVSREHRTAAGQSNYWFAFHPYQRERLESATEALVAFGCGSAELLLLIPFGSFQSWLPGMNVTDSPERTYWHVSIFREGDKLILHRKQSHERIDLTPYLVPSKALGAAQ